MRARRLFENPDHVCLTGNYLNQANCLDAIPMTYLENEAYPFGYRENEMILGAEGEIHPDVVRGGRHSLKFPGRIWLKRKIISFWNYPSPDKIKSVLLDLEKAFLEGNYFIDDEKALLDVTIYMEYGDPIKLNSVNVNIVNDPEYKIEVMTAAPDAKSFWKKQRTGDWSKYGYTSEHKTEFISLQTYENRNFFHQRSKEELDSEHGISPSLKKKKSPNGNINVGSRRYATKKPLAYRQSLQTSESIEFPSLKHFTK